MAKCKWCDREVRILEVMEIRTVVTYKGATKSDDRRFIAICDDCARDTLYHMEDTLKKAAPAQAPTLKG